MQEEFLKALADAGLTASQPLVLDGNFRRFNVHGDKKGRRNGWYRYVHVSSDYAWGVFGCNKRGIHQKWSNKAPAQVTAYEIKARRAVEKKIKNETEEMQTKAAIKAANIWSWLQTPTEHPYATRKGVGLYGVKILNSALVVPIYSGNSIVSLQYIFPDGGKRYMEWGQKKGGFFWIGAESDVIYVTEGYATAASIHRATDKHVVIAFDAGNIPDVVHAVRAMNPDKKIIIAADNDQWTSGNPGVSKAQEAAANNENVTIIIPPFNYEDPAHPTDWNDYHARFGIDALARELLGMNKPREIAIADDKKWRMTLVEGKQQMPGYRDFDPKSKENAYLFIENHEFFKDMVAYNTFNGRITLTRCMPWDAEAQFKPRAVTNRDYFNITRALERYGIKTSKDVVEDAIEAIAEQRKINPPRDYLEALRWDSVPRLNKWLTYYLGAEKQSPEYLALVGAKWIMGSVSRVYVPGMKFDNVLILEGGQDNKKSMLFKKLTTFDEESYFLEFSGDVTHKDSLGMMQGRLVVEMSELASVRRAVVEEMKTFVTREIDTFRPAWGRTILERKRIFILAATTNNDSADGYLVDPTGNRRYWPVGCGEFDMDALIQDKDQLWAEAVVRWKAGEKTWLESAEEKELAKFEQSQRQHEDAWLEPIQNYLIGKLETDIYRVCKEAVGLNADQIKKTNEDRARHCLKKLGWDRSGRPRTENGRITIWTKKSI